MNNILIIGSSQNSVDTLVKFLTQSGYYVMSLSDGVGAQTKIKLSPPDLIIIDCELERGSGYDVCKQLKGGGEAFIPVLMMSATSDQHSQVRAIASGADDFMSKMDDSSVILSKIKSLIRIKNLSDQLKLQYAALEERDRLLDFQLKMARRVQGSLIKERDFIQNNIRFVSKYEPAMDIGGDFYDILKLDEDCIGVAIGDVSGHGISASLLTAMLNMMTRNLAPKYFNPAQFLFHMNNEFYNIFENSGNEMYACVFYAVINTKKKRIYYSNSGQAIPLHVKYGGGTVAELAAYGMPIGMMNDSVYEHKIAIIEEGDAVLFFTDGLSDNMYKGKEEVFSEKIRRLLLDADPALPPDEVIKLLLAEFSDGSVARNRKYELDDVSIIMCKI